MDEDKIRNEITGWLDILRTARVTANADEASEELRFLLLRPVPQPVSL